MSQETLLRSLVLHVPATTLMDAARKDVDFDTAVANLKALFAAHLEAHQAPMSTAKTFLNYAHDYGAKERELAAEMVDAIDTVICDGMKARALGSSDLNDRDWVTAVKYAVANDQVGTLMKLDEAGLIDRKNVGLKSLVHRLWDEAIVNSAQLCNRYLLTTTSIADLGGFDQEDPTWPGNTDLARDIVAHIPESDLPEALALLNERARYTPTSEHLQSAAETMVAAMLERYAQDPQRRQDAAFTALLATVVDNTHPVRGNRLHSLPSASIMLDLLEKTNNLRSEAGFRYAQFVVGGDKNGEWISPERLRSLLEKGLNVQSDPAWGNGGEARHLLVAASLCHIDVIDDYVTDREAFIRDFGVDFVSANCRNESASGINNAPLMKLATLGYPFGPISVLDYQKKEVVRALHERIHSGSGTIDAFLVGHLCGHLHPTDTWNGLSPLHVAVGHAHVPTVQALSKMGFSVNEALPDDFYDSNSCSKLYSHQGATPIVVAVKRANPDLIRTLIDLGADVGVKAPTGATLMQLTRGDEELKKLIRSARTGNAVLDSLKDVAVAPSASAKKSSRLDAL